MKQDQPGFFESCIGLVFEPAYSTSVLLDTRNPPHALSCLLLFFVTLATPVIVQLSIYHWKFSNVEAVLGVSLTLSLLLLLFVLLQRILLLILRVKASMHQVFALACYCAVPLTFALLLIYLFNFLSDGRLTVVEFIVTGSAPFSSKFLKVLPFAFLVVQLNILLLFYYGLRVIGRLGFFSGVFITIFSVAPLYGAFIMAAFVGELLHSGTIETFQTLLWSVRLETIQDLLSSPPPPNSHR